MSKVVEIRNVKIGEGIPKICIPLVGTDIEELSFELAYTKELKVDLIEWRIDYYKELDNIDSIKQALKYIRKEVGILPLLVTFRSKKEGGERELSPEAYLKLNKLIIETGDADIIDIELFIGEEIAKEIVAYARQYDIKVIMSNHDFNKTPSKEEIVKRLCRMQELGADIIKIAVMPQVEEDVLTLLSATNIMYTQYADRPLVTMSMSRIGFISRLVGEVFGSSITFGSGKSISAPGQVSATNLYAVLRTIHEAK